MRKRKGMREKGNRENVKVREREEEKTEEVERGRANEKRKEV